MFSVAQMELWQLLNTFGFVLKASYLEEKDCVCVLLEG